MSYVLRGDGRDGRPAAIGAWAAGGEPVPGGAQVVPGDRDIDAAERGPATGAPVPAAAAMDICALFRQHYAELVRLAVMLVGDRAAAEDVVQEVFARLHARRDRIQPRGEHLAYVRASVLNGCRTVLRRRALVRRLGAARCAVPDLAQESAEHEVIRAEGRRQVLAALAGLPRRRREVLVLRYYLGLREAEIAAVLGITPGTVKSTTARGIRELGRALGEER